MVVWDYYLGISDDFLDALLLIRECPAEASPSTNMDELYHSVLWCNPALKSRKSYKHTTEMEIDMTARCFSHRVLDSQFIPSDDVGVGGVLERAGSSAGFLAEILGGGIGRHILPLAPSLSAEPHHRRASPPFHSDELHRSARVVPV